MIWRNRKSFTLLETLLVVAIISILAGFTFPLARNSIKAARFRAFKDKVYLFLDYAKTQAVIKGKVLEAEFDSQAGQVRLLGKDGGAEQEVLFKAGIPDEIRVKFEPDKVIFYPDGTIEEFEVSICGDKREAVFFSKGFDGRIALKDDL